MYGRCGTKATLAPAGSRMRPSPQGHRPAMARMSVLFPDPDSPPSSTRSPGLTLMSTSSITTRPSRCTMERSVSWMASVLVFSTTISETASASISSSASCSSPTRLADADHSASRMKLSPNQFSALRTAVKAVAICMMAPSVSSPEKYFGAASSTGRIGEKNVLLLSIQVRWPCWRMTPSQRFTTSLKVSFSCLRSSSAPLMRAMLSEFSRTRVSS